MSNSTQQKIIALESSLQQSLVQFRELVLDLEQLHMDSENYKVQYLSIRDKCENKTCNGAEELKKIIATKDQIIQSVASTLTKLNETKNFNILTDVFKILCEDSPPSTLPIEGNHNPICSSCTKINPTTTNVSPKKEADTSITEDVSYNESLCEIEGTPGRKSPIIHTKKTRSKMEAKSSDCRVKKKCPDDWPTPDSKTIKLTYPTPRSKPGSGRLRQSRLNLVKLKQSNVVDLTCSPEISAQNNQVQALIKKESLENDDTILPSPTSGPTNFDLLKVTSKASPSKFKKPPLSLKFKVEKVTKPDENKDLDLCKDTTNTGMEESISTLNQCENRLKNGLKKEMKSPVKMEIEALDADMTDCESLIQDIAQRGQGHVKREYSPTKRPLAENINVMNTPPENVAESSMSILRPETNVKPTAGAAVAPVEIVKRKIPELVEPVYQEPAVRKKAEKRNLQGWSCEECKHFFGEIYKDDPVMLAKKINECSKHRGRHNPARPKTPPNFWNPRWEVPVDTEELNRMNNAP